MFSTRISLVPVIFFFHAIRFVFIIRCICRKLSKWTLWHSLRIYFTLYEKQTRKFQWGSMIYDDWSVSDLLLHLINSRIQNTFLFEGMQFHLRRVKIVARAPLICSIVHIASRTAFPVGYLVWGQIYILVLQNFREYIILETYHRCNFREVLY